MEGHILVAGPVNLLEALEESTCRHLSSRLVVAIPCPHTFGAVTHIILDIVRSGSLRWSRRMARRLNMARVVHELLLMKCL